MHTNQTYNSLAIENPEILCLPKEIKSQFNEVNWSETVWNTFGLPAFNSNFCLSGEQLYFESGPDGRTALKQSEFTGSILSSSVIIPEKSENVYALTMEMVFCKGHLCDNFVAELVSHPREEYESGFRKFVEQQEKIVKTIRSRWFQWFYVPYFNAVKFLGIGVVFIVEFFLKCFIWCLEKITPIKI